MARRYLPAVATTFSIFNTFPKQLRSVAEGLNKTIQEASKLINNNKNKTTKMYQDYAKFRLEEHNKTKSKSIAKSKDKTISNKSSNTPRPSQITAKEIKKDINTAKSESSKLNNAKPIKFPNKIDVGKMRGIIDSSVLLSKENNYEVIRGQILEADQRMREQLAKTIPIKSLEGIFALPYQFSELDDRRLPGTNIGYKYAEKIAKRMPLLFLSPGNYEFFKGKGTALSLEKFEDLIAGKNDSFLDGTSRYASFQSAYADYYTKYVNPLCRLVAQQMGISEEDVMFNGKVIKVKDIKWQDYGSGEQFLKNYNSTAENIVYYLDASPTVSDSFTNSTRSSAFGGFASGISDKMKEIQFGLGSILGTDLGYDYIMNDRISTGNVLDAAKDIWARFTKNGALGVANTLLGDMGSVLHGGKIIFPEMWDDSDFSKSISFNIKLRSPNKDKVSLYMDIMAPVIHIICLTAPRKITSNGLGPPFIVRGYSNNSVSFDMGMITSLDISKGDTGSWTLDGIPTEVDISITIKELYHEMSIVGGSMNIANNVCMMDYLSTMCGVNVLRADYFSRLATYINLASQGFSNSRSDFMLGVANTLSNAASWAEGWFGRGRN